VAMPMRVMIVCSSFPPVNAAGVHRTAALCRHLAERGHRVTVLTMPPAPGQNIDAGLAAGLDGNIRVLRTQPWSAACRNGAKVCRDFASRVGGVEAAGGAAWPFKKPAAFLGAWLVDWLNVPDNRIGWFVPALWSALREAKRSAPDVIYSSAPMWTAHLVGLCLARFLGRPWVADCRDPWRDNPFRAFRYAAHRRADGWLERRMAAGAAFIICNTPSARDALAARYPSKAAKILTIPNGYDAAAVAGARRRPALRADGVCTLVHAGSFYGPRSPLPLMQALKLLGRRHGELPHVVRLWLIGPENYDGHSLAGMACRLGISDLVQVTGPLPHAETLRRVRDASAAIVCGHDGDGADLQIPRKFYEYVGLGKPTLVTGGACKAVRRLFNGRKPRWLWLADGRDGVRGMCRSIEEILRAWRKGRLPLAFRWRFQLTADRAAKRIGRLLESAAGLRNRLRRRRAVTPKETGTCSV